MVRGAKDCSVQPDPFAKHWGHAQKIKTKKPAQMPAYRSQLFVETINHH
jgi:hypothetical protein